jgi:hypothetical protein
VTPLTWKRLTLIGGVAAALAFGVSRLAVRSGLTPAQVPWSVMVVTVAIGVAALWAGWAVRQYQNGNKPNLPALRAARTVAFVQAAAMVGALMVGVYAGYALALVGDWGHAPRRAVILSAVYAAGVSLGLIAAGLIAERWCRITPRDDDSPPPPGVAAA